MHKKWHNSKSNELNSTLMSQYGGFCQLTSGFFTDIVRN